MWQKIKSIFKKSSILTRSSIDNFTKKEVESSENNKIDFSGITANDVDMMMKYGKGSNKLGKWESKPFVELSYGLVKKDLPALMKQNDLEGTINAVMSSQFKDFKISKCQTTEVIGFILWIKEQMNFIDTIEAKFLYREPKPEMLAAGVHRLQEFGVLSTIDALAKGNILNYEKIEALPYYKVYEKLKLDTIHSDIEEKYNEIIKNKK